jgi:hypothetical protein
MLDDSPSQLNDELKKHPSWIRIGSLGGAHLIRS